MDDGRIQKDEVAVKRMFSLIQIFTENVQNVSKDFEY